jgi:hypothetical protein
MPEDSASFSVPQAAELMALARAGGPRAALAARRAAWLAERNDPALAREALALAASLEPLDPSPRLALARLAAEQGDFAQARSEAAAVLAGAVDQAARARAAFILGELARVSDGPAAARGFFEQALKIEDALLGANRSDATAARWYARIRGRIADLDASEGERSRARTGAEGALALLRATAAAIGEPPVLAADIADAELRLGALELDDNQPASARRRFDEAIGRYEALAVSEKDEPHWRAVLADAWALAAEADYLRGAPEKARTAMDKALQARLRLAARHTEEAWGLAGTWRLRGALRAALGDAAIAADSFAQARALAGHLAARSQGEAANRFFVHTLLDQADHALRSGQLDLAREAADTARMRAEAFARADGADPILLTDVGACWDRLGEIARSAKAHTQAQEAFARAVTVRRLARERDPASAQFARGLAAALVKQGEAALEAGANASARAAFQESAAMRQSMLAQSPDDPRAAQALAAALERLGLTAMAEGDRETARRVWEEELALAERIFPDPLGIDAVRFCAIVEAHLARTGGRRADGHRRSALAGFDELARAGVLSDQEAALRKKLWSG